MYVEPAFPKKHAKGTKLPADAKNKGEGARQATPFLSTPSPFSLTLKLCSRLLPSFCSAPSSLGACLISPPGKEKETAATQAKQEKLKILEKPLVLLVRTRLKRRFGNLHRSA